MKKLSLRLQIVTGFGSILLLLLTLSIASYTGLKSTYSGYIEYRNLARDTNLSSRIQANMLSMRLAVLKYLKNQSIENRKEYSTRKTNMLTFLKEAKTEITNPNRSRLIEDIDKNFSSYDAAFKEVIKLYDQRNKIVENILDPSGLIMHKENSKIIRSAYEDEDPEAAYYASLAQERLLLARVYVARYLVTNNKSDAQRANTELNEKMSKQLDELDKSLQNPVRRRSLKTIRETKVTFENAFSKVVEIITERNNYIDNTLNKIGPRIANNIEKTELAVKSEQDALGPKLQKSTEAYLIMISIISVLALFFGIIISLTIARAILKPIGGEPSKILGITQKIADGNLSESLNIKDSDTGIYRSVASMSERLKSLIGSMVNNTEKLSSLSKTSIKMSEENVESSEEQRSMNNQVESAVDELSKSFFLVAKNANICAEKSEQGMQKTSSSREAIKSTVDSTTKLFNKLSESMEVIQKLQEQSSQIGGVIEVINNISDQTNLLALNAAIEAARAGEQGRGFSVVADEVRSLAQRTQESTTEIQEIIQDLQSGTSETVSSIEACTKQAQETVDRSNKTDKILSDIHSAISEIASMNTQIAASTEEQSAVSKDISQSMSSISKLVQSINNRMIETKKINDDVENSITDLKKQASVFKLKQGVST